METIGLAMISPKFRQNPAKSDIPDHPPFRKLIANKNWPIFFHISRLLLMTRFWPKSRQFLAAIIYPKRPLLDTNELSMISQKIAKKIMYALTFLTVSYYASNRGLKWPIFCNFSVSPGGPIFHQFFGPFLALISYQKDHFQKQMY